MYLLLQISIIETKFLRDGTGKKASASSETFWAEAQAHKFIQAQCHHSASTMQKQMVHLGVEAPQRDTDKPLQQASSQIIFYEQTVIIQGESVQLHAVCQHCATSYISTHSHW